MDRHLDGRVEAQIYLKGKQEHTIHMQMSDKKITETSSSHEKRSFCSLLDLLLSSGGCRYIQKMPLQNNNVSKGSTENVWNVSKLLLDNKSAIKYNTPTLKVISISVKLSR